MQLFAAWASRGTAEAGFALDTDNAGRIARLCRRLDGIPFAIELAAARMRSMSVGAIEARLDKRFNILTGGARTAPCPASRPLQALIDFSYDLLAVGRGQTLLARLSIFAVAASTPRGRGGLPRR